MTHRSALLHIVVGLGFLFSAFFMPSPTPAEMKTQESQQGTGDMKSMKKMMMGQCREHHDKASKVIDQMMMKMEEGQRSDDATTMRATLEASQNGLADLKQDMATCMNMMNMMEKMESGMGSHMGEMGGMREGMGGMMERKNR